MHEICSPFPIANPRIQFIINLPLILSSTSSSSLFLPFVYPRRGHERTMRIHRLEPESFQFLRFLSTLRKRAKTATPSMSVIDNNSITKGLSEGIQREKGSFLIQILLAQMEASVVIKISDFKPDQGEGRLSTGLLL